MLETTKKYFVEKIDGRVFEFDNEKIKNAILNAVKNCHTKISDDELICIINNIEVNAKAIADSRENNSVTVEAIQDLVITELKNSGYEAEAIHYSSYKKERETIRGLKHSVIESARRIGEETTRGNDGNANVGNNFSSKLLQIASDTNKWTNLATMPKKNAKLHENGDLYHHDLDSYNLTTNCLHVDTLEVFKRGFNTGYGWIRQPKRITSAAELSCILLQSSQNDMFGGQSHVDFDNAMAPWVEASRKEIRDEVYADHPFRSKKWKDAKVEEKLLVQVHRAMKAVVFNLNTMHSRAGSQVPFSTLNIGIPRSKDAALVCKVLLEEYNKGLGKGEQPIWPNIIFRLKKGVNKPGDKYYYLFQLATRVCANRMNPTFMNLDADFNLEYYNKGIIPATMGCRTYICSNINKDIYGGAEGPARRGNGAPVTINLPRLGILANKDITKFFELLDEKLNDSVECLLHRIEVLKHRKGKDLPFVIGERLLMGSEYVGPNDSIEPVLKHMSWAIGFIGLAETVKALTGYYYNQDDEARELAYKIVQHIRDFTDTKTQELKLNFSTYATPAEGLSGKFVVQDRKRFGVIKGITDKDYYTNSFHVPVNEKISITEKINIEAPFHKMCNGGHITYIEFDGHPTSAQIEKVLMYAYTNTNISYIGINFHLRYCRDCGKGVSEVAHTCPHCGSERIQGVSRVTGYLSLDERFTYGKQHERKNRRAHNTVRHAHTYINTNAPTN